MNIDKFSLISYFHCWHYCGPSFILSFICAIFVKMGLCENKIPQIFQNFVFCIGIPVHQNVSREYKILHQDWAKLMSRLKECLLSIHVYKLSLPHVKRCWQCRWHIFLETLLLFYVHFVLACIFSSITVSFLQMMYGCKFCPRNVDRDLLLLNIALTKFLQYVIEHL